MVKKFSLLRRPSPLMRSIGWKLRPIFELGFNSSTDGIWYVWIILENFRPFSSGCLSQLPVLKSCIKFDTDRPFLGNSISFGGKFETVSLNYRNLEVISNSTPLPLRFTYFSIWISAVNIKSEIMNWQWDREWGHLDNCLYQLSWVVVCISKINTRENLRP